MLIRALRILPLLSILLAAQPSQDSTALARKALDLVLAGQYADFLQMSTADVQKSLPAAELAKVGAMIKTYGAMEKLGDPAVTRSGPNSIVVFPAKFANQNINFRIIINSSGLVSGFFQLPGGVNWQRPEYSQPATFKERDVTVGRGRMEVARNADRAGGRRTVPGGRAGSRLGTERSRRNRGRRQGIQGSGRGTGFARHRGAALREAHHAVPRARRLHPELHRAGGDRGGCREGHRAAALPAGGERQQDLRDRPQPGRVRGAANRRAGRQTGRHRPDGRECAAARRPAGGTGGVHGHQRRPAGTVQGACRQK